MQEKIEPEYKVLSDESIHVTRAELNARGRAVAVVDREGSFTSELRALLHRHGVDSRANVEDFVLAEYLVSCLQSFALTAAWSDELRKPVRPTVTVLQVP